MNRIRRWLIKTLGGYTLQPRHARVRTVQVVHAHRDDLIDELRVRYGARTVFIPQGNRIDVTAYPQPGNGFQDLSPIPGLLDAGPSHVIIVPATECKQNRDAITRRHMLF